MHRRTSRRPPNERSVKATLLADDNERTFALIFDTGDEVISSLQTFAAHHRLTASRFTAIGAFSEVTLGFFDWDAKQYHHIPINEQVEVIALLGDIALGESGPTVHAHIVVGLADATTRGGHLIEGIVRPTLEVILEESPAHLHRVSDPDTGLALIRIRDSDVI